MKNKLVLLSSCLVLLIGLIFWSPVANAAITAEARAQILNQLQAILAKVLVIQQQLQTLAGLETPAVSTTSTIPAATSTSPQVPNALPRVSILFPSGNTQLNAPASTGIVAAASDVDGAISKVEFFQGSTSLGTATGSVGPWQVRWNNITKGIYSITARATDDKGAQATSEPVILKVGSVSDFTGRFNQRPSITISGVPATSTSSTLITIDATVADPDGIVINVVFSEASSSTDNGSWWTDTTSTFSAATSTGGLLGVTSLGDHTFSAIATDSNGEKTRSASSTVSIKFQ